MKKIFTLSLLVIGMLGFSESSAQTAAIVQKNIEQANKQFVKWFNTAKADSIVAQYHPEACITGRGCGKTFLLNYYQTETAKYTFRELKTVNVTVKGNTATENGQWKILLGNGVELTGKYQTEWQQVNNRWMIFKETVLE